MNKQTIVVNLLGGPGVGKSIYCAKIFTYLKLQGVNCEMTREYAKELVWEGDLEKLKDQESIYKEQKRRLLILDNKVDVVVTDAPLISSLFYIQKEELDLKSEIINDFSNFNNLNFFLNRVENTPFQKEGRYQTELESKALDFEFKKILCDNNIIFVNILGHLENSDFIAKKVTELVCKLV